VTAGSSSGGSQILTGSALALSDTPVLRLAAACIAMATGAIAPTGYRRAEDALSSRPTGSRTVTVVPISSELSQTTSPPSVRAMSRAE